MTVDDIIGDVLRREGWPTYTDRPSDKGGPTKGGITLQALSAWLGRPATVAQLQALTEADARVIYRTRYVSDHHLDAIADQAILALMVDWCVTSWIDDPTKALQAILGVPVDGVFGPRTRAALGAVTDPRRVFVALLRARQQFVTSLALDAPDVRAFLAAHPESQLHNLAGWLNRNFDFLA